MAAARRLAALLLAALAAGCFTVRSAGPRAADYVVVVMLDGARPDILRRAQAPVIHGLEAEGTSWLQARTAYPSQTRVAFVTLPTGAYPEHHGIVGGDEFKDADWNTIPAGDEDPIATQALVARGTFFEDATAAGLTSVYAAMKGYELVGARGATWTINGKVTIDQALYATRYAKEVEGSAEVAAQQKQLLSRQLMDQLLALVRQKRPNLVVVNLGSADYAGHAFGPLSPYYARAIEYEDALIGELLRSYEELGLRARTAVVISADHGFSDVDARRVIAPFSDTGGHRLAVLTDRGIEHFVTNTGGLSMGVYVRDKSRIGEAVRVLRAQPWIDAIYCEDARAGCDRSLSSLHDFFPGRSPQLMVDLDDDATLNAPNPGQHGTLRAQDMSIPLVFSGAGVAKGRVLGKAELVDIAPTVLRLLGVEPKRLQPDGHVLEEALAR